MHILKESSFSGVHEVTLPRGRVTQTPITSTGIHVSWGFRLHGNLLSDKYTCPNITALCRRERYGDIEMIKMAKLYIKA